MRFRDALISAWRTGNLVIYFVIPCACLASDEPTPAPQAAVSSLMPESPGHFLIERVVGPLGQQLQLMGRGNLNLPRRSQMFRSFSPLRQVNLLGGDRVTAEVLCNDGEHIELRLRSGQRTIIRRDTIASISVPAGEQELLYEAFEQSPTPLADDDSALDRPVIERTSIDPQHAASGRSSLKLTANARPLRYALREAKDVSTVQFWFRVDARPLPLVERSNGVEVDSQPSALRVDLDFGTGEGTAHWGLRTAGNRLEVVTGHLGESSVGQSVLLDQGWHCLTALFRPDHATISVGDSLLVSTAHSLRSLQSIQFASDLVAWIDDLQIRRQTLAADGPARVSTDDDCVTLHNSDQFYGHLKKVDSESVMLSRAGGDLVIPWSRVMTIWLRQSDRAVAGAGPAALPIHNDNQPVSPTTLSAQAGQWGTVEFQSSFNFPHQKPDHLQVSLLRAERTFLIAWHPFLGEIAIGWNQVARIKSHFYGRCLMLDARILHFGDSIREDFRRPIPDGTHWSREFDLPSPLPSDMDVWLAIDVVDLEPSGPGTPPASPFLKELRSGRLLTQIKVNQESAGDLNRWIHFRSSPQYPERLRCRLPTGALSVGCNKISLIQLPRNDSRTGFDNCELSNIRLEIIPR